MPLLLFAIIGVALAEPQVERSLGAHTDATFCHRICPARTESAHLAIAAHGG